jgi:hypothetical protein
MNTRLVAKARYQDKAWIAQSNRDCHAERSAEGAERRIVFRLLRVMRLVWVSIFASALLSATVAFAADLAMPQQVTAGTNLTINTSGSGQATLILVGPGSASRHSVQLGSEFTINGSELRDAGRYTVVLKSSGGDTAKDFFVVAAAPGDIAFLAQPSRVPTARPKVISGTAVVLDKYNNFVMTPTPVKFELAIPDATPVTRTATSSDGIAWVRMDSGKKDGPAQFVASTGDISVRRVVQQVAAEPCNIVMHAQRDKNGILVQTDPVRDCSGNNVPDGTIVTFTQEDSSGKSTVDASVKRGIARAELPASNQATISVASGVVMGNEIRWRGGE